MRGYFSNFKLLVNPTTNRDALPVSLAIGYEHPRGLRKHLAQMLILSVDFDAVTTILPHSVVSKSVLAL